MVWIGFNTGDEVWSSPAWSQDGRTVVVGSYDHHVYALRLGDDGSLTEVGELETGGGVYSSPVVAPDGTVVVGSDDGCVYALRGPERGDGG